nr:hypothetical protein [Chitinophagaceae bacterium]
MILCIALQTTALIAQQTFNEHYFKDGMYIFDDITKITPEDLIENHKTDLGLTESDEWVRTIHEALPNGTFRSKYELYHNNVAVQGSAINLLGDKGVLLRASGFWIKNLDLPTTNIITSTTAIQTAINFVGAELYLWEDSLLEATLKEES